MPLSKVDYSKIVIYKIQHKEIDELLYVGSTTDFTRRKSQHKTVCNSVEHKRYNLKIYKMIRDNGGFDNFNIIVIKEYPCQNKREAEAEEDKVMREMKANMNAIRPYVSREERLQQKRDYQHHYRLENEDRIKEEKKQYRLENKDKIAEYKKQYRLENRDKVNERKKQYRLENRDEINERRKQKITCECGCVLTKRVMGRHQRSKRHRDFVNMTEQ